MSSEHGHTNSQQVWSNLGGHAMAGVEDGFVVVLRALVQAVATGLTVPHLKHNAKIELLQMQKGEMQYRACARSKGLC